MEVVCWRQPPHLQELLDLELWVLDPAILLLQLLDEVTNRGMLRAAGPGALGNVLEKYVRTNTS